MGSPRLRRHWAAALAALLLAAPGTSRAAAAPTEFVFSRLNGSHPHLSLAAEPAVWGPCEVRLQSPDCTLVVDSHRLELTPDGNGAHRARFEVTASGEGRLVADVQAGTLSTRREDSVRAPLQAVTLEGRLSVERRPGGYVVTPLELPRAVSAEIHTGSAAALVAWCESSVMLRWVGADCAGLGRFLTRVSLPLPRPGEDLWVPRGELTEAEAAALDGYLERSRAR